MDKLLDFIFKNIKTNFKEVSLVVAVAALVYIYKQDQMFFSKVLDQHISDKIFYRKKADSIQAEFNELQNQMIKDKSEELKFLRSSNNRLDRLLQ